MLDLLSTWSPYFAGAVMVIAVALGGVLALLTGPGVWLMLLAATLVNWLWEPGTYSWWTIAACTVLGLVGELLEFFASGIGAKKFGGTSKGAWASIGGGLLGALVGTFAIPVPIIGTIIGSVLGAAGAALLAERHWAKRPWDESHKAAAGAAAGRLAATVIKLAVAGIVGAVLLFGLISPL